MEPRLKYLGKNTVIFAISSFATKAISFILLPLYTSILSTGDYGIQDLLSTIASLMVPILTIDIADAVLRYSMKNAEPEKIFSFGMYVLRIGSLLSIVGLTVLYSIKMIDWPFSNFFFLFATFFSNALNNLMMGYLRGIDRVKEVGIAAIISSTVTLTLNVLLIAIFRVGVNGLLISMMMGPLMSALYGIVVSGVSLRFFFRCECEKESRIRMMRYSIPLIFGSISLWINNSIDRFFIVNQCDVSENGIYSVANKIPMLLATAFMIFTQAWGLSAIREYDSEDGSEFFSKIYRNYFAVILLAASILVLCNVSLCKILFRNEFYEAWKSSTILLVAIVLNASTAFTGTVFTASGKTQRGTVTVFLAAVVNIVMNMILIPNFGIIGAAIATVVGYLVMLISRFVLSKDLIQWRLNFMKGVLAFAIFVLQVIFDHHENHLYLGQLICFLLLVGLYYKTLINLGSLGIMTIKKFWQSSIRRK